MKLQGIWETMPVLDTVKHIMKTFDNIWKKLEILLEATVLWTHLSSFMDNWDMGSMSETTLDTYEQFYRKLRLEKFERN